MEAQGWSSLPADLVNRVADCLLATNDLDCYVDLRAVCHGWRSSTADPKTSHDDERFHPTRWIALDNLSSESDTCLFVNASTGRFLRMRLPLLRDYHFVTSTTGGFLVLAEREPPHAARVLNPFTGTLTRFKAPMPDDSPSLVVVKSMSDEFKFFHAHPESEQFHVEQRPVSRSVELAPSLQSGRDTQAESDASEVALGPIASSFLVLRCLAVKLAAGEMLRVYRSPLQGVQLFRMSSRLAERKMERVYSIGGCALIVGERCITIHADSFPSINANSVYYMKEEDDDGSWYMYDLAQDKEERIVESSICIYPASILQLLVEYTMRSPCYQPALDQLHQFFGEMMGFSPTEEKILQIADSLVERMNIFRIADDLQELEDDECDNFVE
uniref:KIB1-4 beta-propeller domain-containing protein n=1 Tax=Setaria italica TaxID=4555 RepID=K3XSG2_SETIT